MLYMRELHSVKMGNSTLCETPYSVVNIGRQERYLAGSLIMAELTQEEDLLDTLLTVKA